MAEVLVGKKTGEQLVVSADKMQVYGLAGNDTLLSDNHDDVLLIGGSGDDSLIMTGGTGTLSGGKGADTFELTFSADKKLSAVIEDLEPSSDKIVVNFDGNTMPKLSSVASGNDVVWKDADGFFTLTLKGARDNDYFDGTLNEEAWEVLRLTNNEREKESLAALTLSEGLTAGASVRAEEITEQAKLGKNLSHTRPNGTKYYTVLEGKYNYVGENLEAVAATPEEVMVQWISSESHKKNILDEKFRKLGVGYNYYDADTSNRRYYWAQMFADSLNSQETVSMANLLTANIEVDTVSNFILGTADVDEINNSIYSATINALGGNDLIANAGAVVSISGGKGKDTIENSGTNITIRAGKGNDFISLASDVLENLIQYKTGDGNDTILGFNETSTLSIAGDEYTPATVGNDIVVAVGNDSIKLLGAADLDSVNIIGTRSNVFIFTNLNDKYRNSLSGATLEALDGNDIIFNSGASAAINSGNGNDSISNDSLGTNSTLTSGAGDDTVENKAASVTIAGGMDNDSIVNYGLNVKIDGDAGNDYISNDDNIPSDGKTSKIVNGENVTISNVTIEGGDGNDSIKNTASYVTINAGADNDSIYNSGEFVTINSGDGDDSIDNSGEFVTINSGDGDDSIDNGGESVTINSGDGDDYIYNNRESVTINSGDGNDSIDNWSGEKVSILSGIGNDSIDNSGEFVTINSGDGDDYIYNNRESVTINSGDGNDSIKNTASYVTINAGADNDSIYNSGEFVTINSGDGDDSIDNSGEFGHNQ